VVIMRSRHLVAHSWEKCSKGKIDTTLQSSFTYVIEAIYISREE